MGIESSTIERIVPDLIPAEDVIGQATLKLHLQRYEFAASQLRPGRLLDIACGVGYGTHLMAEKMGGVTLAIGVDLSPEVVEYAQARYASERVRFRQHDALTFTDAEGFDSIVSLETLEHLPDPRLFVDRLIGFLRPGGVFIASVPTTPSVDANPYHLHDFTERSFRRMMAPYPLREVACFRQIQPYSPTKTLSRQNDRMIDLRQGLVSYYLEHPAALGRRIGATLRYGFVNRYITIAWQKEI